MGWFKKMLAGWREESPPVRKVEAEQGSIAVGSSISASTVIGGNLVVVNAAYLKNILGSAKPPPDLQKAVARYLEYLVERYRYLDFKGMGVSDRVPLQLELSELYVPLKARIEMPKGETWARELRSAGRKIPDADREALGERLSEPRSLHDLLEQGSGLIILGDPGAGKTTFLKHLTLKLATGVSEKPRLPVLAPLSAYANALSKGDVRLDDFICAYFHQIGVDLPFDAMLRQALDKGSAVVMLDGLDEVKELAQRETVVRRVIDFYTFHKKKGNKFLLTSRIIGYREVRPTGADFAECTLDDFGDEQVKEFVERWTRTIEKAARGETAMAAEEAEREKAELLEATRHNPGVRRLAANPLLLTILALMKRQGVRLPERRVELYQKYIETLLSSWNRARGLGRPPARDLDVVETVRILAPLALWMHEVNPGAGLVKHGDLMRKIETIYHERGEDEPEKSARQFLADVHDHTGLLLERGAGEYGFIHLTFEEYLAAVAIAQQGQEGTERITDVLAKHIGNDAWHEVSLLTIGFLGIVQQRDEAAGAVLRALIERAPGKPGEAVVFAGEAVADAWPGGVTPACKNEIVAALLQTMADDEKVKAVTRAAAGNALSRIGDPRFRPDAWHLPNDDLLGFVEIPAGPFLMGSDKKRDSGASDDELPQHKLDVPSYYISRYPVTVAQFRAFVKAEGYKPKDPDCLRGIANHPVRWVTWHEALKYCDWLTQQLRESDKTPPALKRLLREENWIITLPSEAEWEKAARGADGRIYPWGDKPDPNKANYSDTGIGATSAVGCFSGGERPFDCEDLSGNVWEWSRSLWGKDRQNPDYGYPYDAVDGRENLEAPDDIFRVVRGGAFFSDLRFARCAFRYWNDPGYRSSYVGFRVVARPFFVNSEASDL